MWGLTIEVVCLSTVPGSMVSSETDKKEWSEGLGIWIEVGVDKEGDKVGSTVCHPCFLLLELWWFVITLSLSSNAV